MNPTPTGYSVVVDRAAFERALQLARGSYQRDLLHGRESLSGSTLRGLARRYGGRYKQSRDHLLSRMSGAEIPWCEVTVRRGGRRVLVIGALNYRAEGLR